MMFRSRWDYGTCRYRNASSIRFTRILEGHAVLGTPDLKTKGARRGKARGVSARLLGHVALEAHRSGDILACFHGYSVGLGAFSAAAAKRAQSLRAGLPLASFASGAREIDQEMLRLVQRLARHGLLEYGLQ